MIWLPGVAAARCLAGEPIDRTSPPGGQDPWARARNAQLSRKSSSAHSGLDHAHPYRKAKFGAWYYSLSAVAIFTSKYIVNPPRVRVTAGERVQEGVTAVVQNS